MREELTIDKLLSTMAGLRVVTSPHLKPGQVLFLAPQDRARFEMHLKEPVAAASYPYRYMTVVPLGPPVSALVSGLLVDDRIERWRPRGWFFSRMWEMASAIGDHQIKRFIRSWCERIGDAPK